MYVIFFTTTMGCVYRMITESERSEENKTLPLGFTKFNARDAKNIVIPVYKPKSK